jgi:hypothetical protein
MLHSLKRLRPLAQRCVLGLIIGLVGCFVGMVHPALADSLADAPKYMSADGRDLTAMAECLPKKLSQSNLDRALQESKNDFLEKVFDTKLNYNDYKLDETELEYLACMESKGVVPQIKR